LQFAFLYLSVTLVISCCWPVSGNKGVHKQEGHDDGC
jgi:hypothetical protein